MIERKKKEKQRGKMSKKKSKRTDLEREVFAEVSAFVVAAKQEEHVRKQNLVAEEQQDAFAAEVTAVNVVAQE